MQRVIVALALSAGATTALQFAAPVRPVSKHICRAEADAPVTAADIEDAAEAAEEAPVVAEEAALPLPLGPAPLAPTATTSTEDIL